MEGLLNIYKERGFTSFDVVAKLRGILGEKKIGHLGTLDPEAEGVLPVLVGRATKLAPLLEGGEKVYRTTLLLGITTDTQDTTGRLLLRRPVEIEEEALRALIRSFEGEQQQIPPEYSAKKVEGQKLVDLARQGREVERKSCPIHISQIEIIRVDLPRVEIRVYCSAGTYIRTLCHDIGEKAGCGGAMESLLREQAGPYRLQDALKLDEITSLNLTGLLQGETHLLKQLLGQFSGFVCHARWEKLARNGNILRLDQGDLEEAIRDGSTVHVMDAGRNPIGLFRYNEKKGLLKPEVMMGAGEPAKPFKPRPSVVSLGKFDGVHVGHQAIFRAMLRQAEEEGLGTLLFSFTNPPEALVHQKSEELLTTAEEKRRLVKELGIGKLIEARFTRAMREMPAETFLKDVLIGRCGMRRIVVGPDCSFGKDRTGNVAYLEAQARELGFTVTVVPKVEVDGEIVSSSRIKTLVKEGKMEEAARCLGRPFAVAGRVGYGRHIGKILGFPTLNLAMPADKVFPPLGVYASMTRIKGQTICSMSNFGVKPTLGREPHPGWETHLFEDQMDCYGLPCHLDLMTYTREEKKFGSLEELREQLKEDERRICEILRFDQDDSL